MRIGLDQTLACAEEFSDLSEVAYYFQFDASP